MDDAIHALRRAAAEPLIAGDAQAEPICAMLTRSFEADPVFDWWLRPDEKRAAARRLLFDVLVGEDSIEEGSTFVALGPEGRAAACAVWLPFETAVAQMTLWEQMALFPQMLRLTGWRRLPRVLALMGALERHHPRTEPHHYLFFLGVDPAHQGQGLGSIILEASLNRLSPQGLPCYLENSNPRNTPLYQRHGFVPGEAFRPRPDAPPMLPMWRPAR